MDPCVKSPSKLKCFGQWFDGDCTLVGQRMDIPCTWTVIGQNYDRHWTGIGFAVQSPSNVCLTTH